MPRRVIKRNPAAERAYKAKARAKASKAGRALSLSREPREFRCVVCGVRASSLNNAAIYCSNSCKMRARNEDRMVLAGIARKALVALGVLINNPYDKIRKPQYVNGERICAECGEPMGEMGAMAVFCSRSCRGKAVQRRHMIMVAIGRRVIAGEALTLDPDTAMGAWLAERLWAADIAPVAVEQKVTEMA